MNTVRLSKKTIARFVLPERYHLTIDFNKKIKEWQKLPHANHKQIKDGVAIWIPDFYGNNFNWKF